MSMAAQEGVICEKGKTDGIFGTVTQYTLSLRFARMVLEQFIVAGVVYVAPFTYVKETGRNPKRVQRKVRKQIQNTGIGTKSQQALKLQQEQLKTERKTVSRKQRETEKQRQFELKQQIEKSLER